MNQKQSAKPTQENEEQTKLPKDVIFGLLSVERRRLVLKYLHDNEGPVTVSDLAEQIAATENDTEVRLISSQQRKRVYVGLYQCHLPKLDDTDVISYDKPRGTVESQPNATQLYPYLAIEPTVNAETDSAQSGDNFSLREKLKRFFS